VLLCAVNSTNEKLDTSIFDWSNKIKQ
jgi:hypothetical protein